MRPFSNFPLGRDAVNILVIDGTDTTVDSKTGLLHFSFPIVCLTVASVASCPLPPRCEKGIKYFRRNSDKGQMAAG